MKPKIDLEHKKKFERVWQKGDYRIGSTAHRMVDRLLGWVPEGATINDYGSGTGRAEVEILKARRHQITMIDIADNALEDKAREILAQPDSPLKMIIADLSDLCEVPHAQWGMCINVLMTVQPDKLDKILSEIRGTCDNLVFEAYNFMDVRLGWDMTTVKLNKDQWEQKLRQYWPDVTFHASWESHQRYIFICKASSPITTESGSFVVPDVVTNLPGIQNLQNKYAGQTCYIIGRGPSLLNLKKEHFGPGPVIAINESIINISGLALDNDIYSQWRNGDIPADTRQYLKPGDTLLVCENPVPKYVSTVDQFINYKSLYSFECSRDFGLNPANVFSHRAALEIAVRIFGCSKIINMGFDSYKNDDRTVLGQGFVQSEYRPGDYRDQITIIKNRLEAMPQIKCEWFFPPEKKEPIRLNIGCGDVPIPGYINIDKHVASADKIMDALDLEYSDNTIDEIYSSHLLEHFGKREVPKALKEWYRVLKFGGKLSLNLPNLEWCLKNWLAKPENEKWGIFLDMIYGLQTNDGEYHKTGFTKARLETLLKEAGFRNISIQDHVSHAQGCFKIECVKRPSITALTLTGDRPEAMALITRWMSHQTVKPDQWLIVSDGKVPLSPVPSPAGIHVDYRRREPQPNDPQHTMIINMKEAVKHIQGDIILIMEDDEYYGPRYIEVIMDKLNRYEVVGIGRSKYYHLPSGSYLKDCNLDNASLAQTAFRASYISEFTTLLEGDQYVDMRIWKHVGQKQSLNWNDKDVAPDREINGRGYIFDDGNDHLYVGLKGLPGRRGICWGHKGDHSHYKLHDTKDRKVLREWLGADMAEYERWING